MIDFEVIESLLSDLMSACANEFPGGQCREAQVFIDVGEYGLALETVVAIYSDEKKIPSSAVMSLIEQLASAMSIERDLLLERLPLQS